MNFATSFTRWVGTAPAGGIALGDDAAPSAAPGPADDRVLATRNQSAGGNVLSAVAATWKCSVAARAVLGTLYVYEEASQTWLRASEPRYMSAGATTYFPVPALIDRVVVAGRSTSGGGVEALLLVEPAPGADYPDGRYDFYMGAVAAMPAESSPTAAANLYLPPRKAGEPFGEVGVITTGAAAETDLLAALGAGRRYVTFKAMGEDVYVAFKAATSAADVSAATGYPIVAGQQESWWIDESSGFLETFSSGAGSLHWYASSPNYEA